jgi:phosphatidylcholine synthase
MLRRKIAAWCVHAYTASGLVLAAWMAVLCVGGRFRAALGLMLAATFVDSTDGWLARRVGVKEIVPSFNGRRLDDIVDFHTYASLPLFLLWRAGVLPAGYEWALLAPLVASVYGFSQTDAKTPDGYFLGFPSYWNFIAFYLYFLRPPLALTLLALWGFALLTFVPAVYLYPSQKTPYSLLTNILTAIWGVALALILTGREWLVPVSLLFPAYYLGLSWWMTIQRRRTTH